jgi:ABC-type lipoprotein release transport system permease subunit
VFVGKSEATSLLGSQAVSVAIAGGTMLIAAMIASLVPAMRAASVDPMEALRNE